MNAGVKVMMKKEKKKKGNIFIFYFSAFMNV